MPNLSNPLTRLKDVLGTKNGKLIAVFGLLVLVAAIPLTLHLAQQVQDIRQRAAGTVCAESGSDTVLVIDKSNSMNWSADPLIGTPSPSVDPTRTRFYQAKVAAKAYADIIAAKNANLPEGSKHKVAVVSFSNSAKTSIDAWLTSDMTYLKQQIDAIVPGDNITGSTCLECGVKKASIILGVSIQGKNMSSQPLVVETDETSLFSKAASIIAPPVYAACSGNRDCGGGQPYCVGGSCVECRNPGSTNDCRNGKVCNRNHRCVAPTPTPVPPTAIPPTARPTATPTLAPTATPAPTSQNNARPDLKNVVIILTDGKANFLDGGTSQLTNTALAEQKAMEAVMTEYTRSNTSYYTIGLGAQSEINEPFLKNISLNTQGKYHYTPDADQLSSIYSTIAQTIGKGAISGVIFNDINKNGVKDPGEGGWPNWEVKALKGTTQEVAASVTSSADGIYNIPGLCNGAYTLQQTMQSGYTPTFPLNPATHAVTLTTTDNQITDKHFGVVLGSSTTPSPSISLSPTSSLTITPSISLTETPTPSTTVTISPTLTGTLTPSPSVISGTSLNLSLLLHGIGASGDNVLPKPDACQRVNGAAKDPSGCLSNQNPNHPERTVTVEILNGNNEVVSTASGKITYDNSTGSFKGSVALDDAITSGSYIVKVLTPKYLKRQASNFVTITSGQSTTLQELEFTSTDVDGDNKLTILDYNLIAECYTIPSVPTACTAEEAEQTDINDDGLNDLFDEGLFRREISVQYGQ